MDIQVQDLGEYPTTKSKDRTMTHHPISEINTTKESPEEKTSKEKAPEKTYTGLKRYWGLMLAAASSLLLSLVNLIAKILPEHGFEAYGVSFWRYHLLSEYKHRFWMPDFSIFVSVIKGKH